MKIRDLELMLVEVPSSNGPPAVRSLLVRLSTDVGLDGWGECPSTFRAEDLPWRTASLLAMLEGRSPFDIEQIAALDAHAEPSIAVALQTALWDLIGRSARQPLCHLLGGLYRNHVPLAAPLPGQPADSLALVARERAEQGFHTLVLPSSGDPLHDLAALNAVQAVIGERTELRLDGQSRFEIHQARDFCRRLEDHALSSFLDPLVEDHTGKLMMLARQTSVPLSAGRSIRNTADVLAVACGGGLRSVVLDLFQLGGLNQTRDAVAVARAGGMGVSLSVSPSLGVGMAAALHLAAALPALDRAHTCYYPDLEDDILTESHPTADGMMAVPAGPGLGVKLDRAKLDRYQVG
ncbi:MAG: mandelate racemase/muconate lactonizing enzyme family protein [Pirellulales bacterium]